jgi:hypothetical protein
MKVYCSYGNHWVDESEAINEGFTRIGPDLMEEEAYICEDCADELEDLEDEE